MSCAVGSKGFPGDPPYELAGYIPLTRVGF